MIDHFFYEELTGVVALDTATWGVVVVTAVASSSGWLRTCKRANKDRSREYLQNIHRPRKVSGNAISPKVGSERNLVGHELTCAQSATWCRRAA